MEDVLSFCTTGLPIHYHPNQWCSAIIFLSALLGKLENSVSVLPI